MPEQGLSAFTLDELLAKLRAAVENHDRQLAEELSAEILRRIQSEAANAEADERRLAVKADEARQLMAAFDLSPSPASPGGKRFDVRGVLRSAGGASASEEAPVYPVWFATNRKPQDDQADPFTSERHPCISYGRVDVHIPHNHRIGETGSSFWKRLRRFELRDDHLIVQTIATSDRDKFFRDLQSQMQEAREDGDVPHALLFLHGFNVSFEGAAVRAAQLGKDLKVSGATAFFSWPSRGNPMAYTADEATIEASERPITDFLVDFNRNCGTEKVHLIAHSMGNRGLLRALQRIAADAQTRGKIKFGQIFLAAPDLDSDLFRDLAYLYGQHADRTTLYASDGDRAVDLSAIKHRAPRAGYFPPFTCTDGVDTICVPEFNIDFWGHSYWAQAKNLLSDIYELMRASGAQLEAGKRQYIDPARDPSGVWRLKR